MEELTKNEKQVLAKAAEKYLNATYGKQSEERVRIWKERENILKCEIEKSRQNLECEIKADLVEYAEGLVESKTATAAASLFGRVLEHSQSFLARFDKVGDMAFAQAIRTAGQVTKVYLGELEEDEVEGLEVTHDC